MQYATQTSTLNNVAYRAFQRGRILHSEYPMCSDFIYCAARVQTAPNQWMTNLRSGACLPCMHVRLLACSYMSVCMYICIDGCMYVSMYVGSLDAYLKRASRTVAAGPAHTWSQSFDGLGMCTVVDAPFLTSNATSTAAGQV